MESTENLKDPEMNGNGALPEEMSEELKEKSAELKECNGVNETEEKEVKNEDLKEEEVKKDEQVKKEEEKKEKEEKEGNEEKKEEEEEREGDFEEEEEEESLGREEVVSPPNRDSPDLPEGRLRSSSQPLDPVGSPTQTFFKDSVETNLLASRLEALNIELFRDPRIAKFFERRNDDLDWKWWGILLSDFDGTMKKNPKTMAEKIRKGIPRQMRGLVWQRLAASKSLELEEQYSQLAGQPCHYEKAVLRDAKRTFPQHEFFQKEAGQKALTNVVRAYLNYDPALEHCQGLTFLAGVLLMHLSPEEAFCTLVQLLAYYQYRFLFADGLQGLHIRMSQLELLMKDTLPNLHQHFQTIEINATMFASSWFLNSFATDLPLDIVFRLFDVLFLEGSGVLFSCALALLKRSQSDLLKMTKDAALDHLKDKIIDKFSGPDDFMEEVAKLRLSTKKLERLEKEAEGHFHAKSEEEKLIQSLTQEKSQLEAEVETYRVLFNSVKAKNKQLEEDVSLIKEEGETLENDIKILTSQLEDLKNSLVGDNQLVYTTLEQQIQLYKTEYGKLLANQAELESELITSKLKYALAEGERQRILIKRTHRFVERDSIDKVVGEGDISSPPPEENL